MLRLRLLCNGIVDEIGHQSTHETLLEKEYSRISGPWTVRYANMADFK